MAALNYIDALVFIILLTRNKGTQIFDNVFSFCVRFHCTIWPLFVVLIYSMVLFFFLEIVTFP